MGSVLSFVAVKCCFIFQVTMSWQSYVDTQMISKNLKNAAIAGLDGNIWAKSAEFKISPDEVKTILTSFEDKEKLASSGIHLAGVYDEPMQGPEAATVTESLGSYLKNCGY